MSFLDKVIAAVTPLESDEALAQARAEAGRLDGNCPWLALMIQHHVQIEEAFFAVRGPRMRPRESRR